MNLLLDTHVLLWWLDDPALLAEEAQRAIGAGDNLVLVSAAVAWGIAIKRALGKLKAPDDLPTRAPPNRASHPQFRSSFT